MIQHLFITLLGRFSLATIVMEDAPNALKLLRATQEEALMNYVVKHRRVIGGIFHY